MEKCSKNKVILQLKRDKDSTSQPNFSVILC